MPFKTIFRGLSAIFRQNMGKTTFLGINGLLIVLFSFLVPQISLGATTIFEDNFETYTIGDLNGQGGWVKETGLVDVNTSRKQSGEKSIRGKKVDYAEAKYYKIGDSVSTGGISFWFNQVKEGRLRFRLYKDNTTFIGGVYLNYYDNSQGEFTRMYKATASHSFTPPIYYSYDEWHLVQIEWNQTTQKIRYKFDDNDWTDWFDTASDEIPNTVNFHFTDAGYYTYIDDIGGLVMPDCETYQTKEDCENSGYCYWWEIYDTCSDYPFTDETNVFPEIPNPEEITIYNPEDDLVIKGTIQIGWFDGQTWAYRDFYAIFTNIATGKKYTFKKSDFVPDLWYYPIEYEENLGTIGEILPDWEEGNFWVDYKLFARKPLKFWETKELWFWGGVIGVEEIKEIPFEYLDIPELELDNCEELESVEKWLCEIKNSIKSIFYPTPKKISELKWNVDLISQKAPMNYLTAIKNQFVDIKDNVETEEVNFKIFNTPGTLSFAGLNFQVENGGGTENFISFLNKFFTFVILFIFGIWAIKFIRKIWK